MGILFDLHLIVSPNPEFLQQKQVISLLMPLRSVYLESKIGMQAGGKELLLDLRQPNLF